MKSVYSKIFESEPLNDELNWNSSIGIAWQRDIKEEFVYGDNYWQNYIEREHTSISRKLNNFRCFVVEKYCSSVIDIGIGCGEFLKKVRLPSLGFDVNEVAVKWLKERELFHDPYLEFPDMNGITLWDVLEHMPDPTKLLNIIPKNCYLFVSIPIFSDLQLVSSSKHYKPEEHLVYFTEKGIVNWFDSMEFKLIELRDDESKCGRQNIGSFVFMKS